MEYIPKIGEYIIATRKKTSKIYSNSIVGLVIDVYKNCCRVITNQGTKIETCWQLFYGDWNFTKV